MRADLPPLAGLLAFEAVARHLSFTRAAKELNLTQSAVSHQIKNLERRLGVELFIRRRNEVQLTDIARDYLGPVRSTLGSLSEATGRIREDSGNDTLSVTCLITFALKCLVPLLEAFKREVPDVTVRLNALTTFEQFGRRDYDLAVRYGSGDWRGYRADWLCGEEIFPICAPSVMGRIDVEAGPQDLRRFTRIRTAFHFMYRDDWPVWMQSAGLEDVRTNNEMVFNLVISSIQAAIDGVGVAMGRSPLVDGDIAAGRLVIPFDRRLGSPSSYHIVSPLEKADLLKVKLFREWLLDRFPGGASSQRTRKAQMPS